jgi:hypothetical protein
VFLAASLTWAPALAGIDDPDAIGQCSKADGLQNQIDQKIARKDDPNTAAATKARMEIDIESLRTKVDEAKISCEKRDKSREREQNACSKKIAEAGDVWKWDAKKFECLDMSAKNQKANPNSGDCNNAELMKGNLQGQKCKIAADTIKDVTSRSEALNQTALGATQAYSTMQAMQATGQQADALNRQQKVMQGLAAMKMITGVMSLSGAASLKAAAGGAEDASKTINSAYKDLNDYCNQDAVLSKMSMEQCFYKNAAERGVDPTQKNYATFERMKSAAEQSQQQADRANALAKTSMVSGVADALVGMQALYMSRQTAQSAVAMGQVVAPTSMGLNPMLATSGGSVGIGTGGPITAGGGPTGNEGISLGGSDGGQIKGGLMGGRPAVFNTYKPQKSGVSGGGGGGLLGGSRGASRAPRRGRGGMKSNTAEGGYTAGGAAPGSHVGAGGDGKDAGAGANPLGDMMCKLFPCNDAGKPIVDGRSLASDQAAQGDEEPETQEAGVTQAELTIFEQISSRYRTLNGQGSI